MVEWLKESVKQGQEGLNLVEQKANQLKNDGANIIKAAEEQKMDKNINKFADNQAVAMKTEWQIRPGEDFAKWYRNTSYNTLLQAGDKEKWVSQVRVDINQEQIGKPAPWTTKLDQINTTITITKKLVNGSEDISTIKYLAGKNIPWSSSKDLGITINSKKISTDTDLQKELAKISLIIH